ncbi:MAG: polysaccharide deacetylase family protein [bacterium]|nr:polysaccharide deacetylase family protein [bacterium]
MRILCLRAPRISSGLALFCVGVILFFPWGGCRDTWNRWTRGVQPGVWLDSDRRIELEGMLQDEIRVMLEDLAAEVRIEPEPARIDPATRGLIPERNGRELDVERTLALVQEAPRGTRVAPQFRSVPPAVTSTDFPEHPVYAGNPNRRAMALVINIAWGEDELPLLAEVLARHGARATFCPVGVWLEGSLANRETLAALVAAGHDVGNHGWRNRPMDRLDAAELAEDLRRASSILEEVAGIRSPYFTPPYGAISSEMLEVSAREGYRTVLWSLDTIDWKLEGVPRIVSRLLSRAHNGAIVLLHPTPQTAPALDTAIPALLADGYRLVTLSELLAPDFP